MRHTLFYRTRINEIIKLPVIAANDKIFVNGLHRKGLVVLGGDEDAEGLRLLCQGNLPRGDLGHLRLPEHIHDLLNPGSIGDYHAPTYGVITMENDRTDCSVYRL